MSKKLTQYSLQEWRDAFGEPIIPVKVGDIEVGGKLGGYTGKSEVDNPILDMKESYIVFLDKRESDKIKIGPSKICFHDICRNGKVQKWSRGTKVIRLKGERVNIPTNVAVDLLIEGQKKYPSTIQKQKEKISKDML